MWRPVRYTPISRTSASTLVLPCCLSFVFPRSSFPQAHFYFLHACPSK